MLREIEENFRWKKNKDKKYYLSSIRALKELKNNKDDDGNGNGVNFASLLPLSLHHFIYANIMQV